MPVEFIDDADDGDDEPIGPPPARRSLLYRVAAAAIVLVAVIVWALTRPGDNTVTGASRPSTSPTVVVPTTFVPRSPSPTGATDTLSCQLDAPVMIPIASAMKRFLPALDLADLNAFRCVRGGGIDGRVVFEAISGRYHRLNIDVEAALRTADTQNISPSLGSDGGRKVVVARIDAVAAGLSVEVTAWGKRGDRAPIYAMRSLADFVSLYVVL